MKKLILISAFISTVSLTAQEKKTVEIYNTDKNGVKEVTPSKTIVIDAKEKTVTIFPTTNGIPSVTPTQVIQNNNVYPVVNGVQQIQPTQVIVPKNP